MIAATSTVASWPGVTLDKAFNARFATCTVPDPRHGEGNQAVFLAGADGVARSAFARALTDLVLAPVDLGALRDGGALVQLGGPLSAKDFLFQG